MKTLHRCIIWLALTCAALAVVVSGSQFVYAVTYQDQYCDYQPTFDPELHACWCEGQPDGEFQCEFIIEDEEWSLFIGCFEQTGNTCTPKYDNDCGNKYFCKNDCSGGSCKYTSSSCGLLYTSCTGT